ncbi:DUF1292 domain-containing protein [Peptoniphilus sp. oral taxon 386]|uniref:DUF1292 domain-containing protein n=1 Tax=Peptoniphilus sp. oral taxon 386 TaxID=652713 RepID=UPI0002E19C54|nr:DUF1292 domain-containing protein [Peptoniphilus sp. oral taxon 386]
MTEEKKNGCCCCGHDHEHEHEAEEFETIVLTLDDDSELECVILGIFDYEERSYIALLPANEEDGEEILIYDFKELENEEVELNVIEDEELFNKVSKEFEALYVEEE